MSGNYNRQDHLYRKAKQEGYRSRAAYKLQELDQKFKLFRRGSKVMDLGCFPGGWLQVALEKVGSGGLVVGVDLREVEPVKEAGVAAKIVLGDLYEEGVRREILSLSGGGVHVVLSDMSPQLSGIRFRDIARSVELAELAGSIVREALLPGGNFVVKLFPSQESEEFVKTLKTRFSTLSRLSLDTSRKTSNEFYLVARGFRPEKLENRQEANPGLEDSGLEDNDAFQGRRPGAPESA